MVKDIEQVNTDKYLVGIIIIGNKISLEDKKSMVN